MAEYNPKLIRLNRDTPLFRGVLPAGTELSIVAVNAICIAPGSPHKSWDVHGLSPDAFEFVTAAVDQELPSLLPTVVEQDEQDDVELPSFV